MNNGFDLFTIVYTTMIAVFIALIGHFSLQGDSTWKFFGGIGVITVFLLILQKKADN